MARRRKLKKYEVAKILYVYDEGSATLDEIYERTGYTRDQVAQVLSVEEIEKREMMDVLKRYGYGREGNVSTDTYFGVCSRHMDGRGTGRASNCRRKG